jgi:hypothetical protein
MHLYVWCHVVWVVELTNVSGYALHLCDAVKNGSMREFFDPENGDGSFL